MKEGLPLSARLAQLDAILPERVFRSLRRKSCTKLMTNLTELYYNF